MPKDVFVSKEYLKSGSVRVRKTVDGKVLRKTFDHDPTRTEIISFLSDEQKKFDTAVEKEKSFEAALDEYIFLRPNGTSPATIRGYNSIKKNMPASFLDKDISQITTTDIQNVINTYSKGSIEINGKIRPRKAKTVKNMYGLISAVLAMKRPEFNIRIQLPADDTLSDAEIEKKEYLPTDEDIARILERAKGTQYEVAFYLAVFGLRRSEICALEIDDVVEDSSGHSVNICKKKVLNKDGEFVVQHQTKTSRKAKDGYKTRTVHITDELYELIMQQDYSNDKRLYQGAPDNIRAALVRYQKQLDIPFFTLHKMRYYFASLAHKLGASDAEIMVAGGWQSDRVMKTVYRHAQPKDVSEAQEKYAKEISKITKKKKRK